MERSLEGHNWDRYCSYYIFVNDMPDLVTDDSKCYKVTNHHSDYLDLDALSSWSLRNELFFSLLSAVTCEFLGSALVHIVAIV